MSADSELPAFPCTYPQCPGLTIRDYFAAHAPMPLGMHTVDVLASLRYAYADAMLKAREQ